MSAQILIEKLKEQSVDATVFFAEVHPLIREDPRGVLAALEEAERAQLPRHRILTARMRAHVALWEPKKVYESWREYLEACRAAGGFDEEPPLELLARFFDEMNERPWAAEVREVAAVECGKLLGQVISHDAKQLEAADVALDRELAASKGGADEARTCALKACVLSKLGKKAEALKFWKKAKDAAPDVAEFWRANSLLA